MEKDYKKTGWVNGSEPDMDAEHMNNIEDGIDGLYHPEFDDSGTVEGITSFPAFLSTVINKMNPIAFYKNFKAGMKYVLHTGSLINNGLCTETGKYAADATQLNPNIENTLAWQVAKVNSDLGKIILGNIPKVAFVYFVGGVGIDIYIEANIFYRIWVGETSIGLEKWDNGTKTIVWSMPTV